MNAYVQECRLGSEVVDGQKCLTIEFIRFANNGQLNWFVGEFCAHKFIMRGCDLRAVKRGTLVVRDREIEVKQTVEVKDAKPCPRIHDPWPGLYYEINVNIAFYPHVTKREHIPEFVLLFSGLDEGEVPEMPKPMSVWERLRHPLV